MFNIVYSTFFQLVREGYGTVYEQVKIGDHFMKCSSIVVAKVFKYPI